MAEETNKMNETNETKETNETEVFSALSTGMADAVERVSPSLVLVDGRRRHPASGVVFASDLVLTADHVLEREEDLSVVTYDGRTLPATFVGRDPSSDLAVLRVPNLNVTPAAKAQTARVGQFLLAVGRPSKDGPMASFGIVSAIGGPLRTRRGGMLEKYIRTDAIPYPGFSGGALIDTQGGVLGIMTSGLAGGVAIGIPATVAWGIGETLANDGQIKRGYLGITSQPVNLPDAQRAGRTQKSGLLIMHVEPGSPAEQAGLLLGDILVSLDGQAINDTGDLQALLSGTRVGNAVPVEVIRGGTLQSVKVTIGQKQASQQETSDDSNQPRHKRHAHWRGFWGRHRRKHRDGDGDGDGHRRRHGRKGRRGHRHG
ncbi:MAG: S1C family serine protease [Ardenticatenaceae bacterium]